jgi:hypothetical protein
MFSQQQPQVHIVLLKESATETKNLQNKNIVAAKIMVEIPKFSLDSQRHDIKEVKSL